MRKLLIALISIALFVRVSDSVRTIEEPVGESAISDEQNRKELTKVEYSTQPSTTTNPTKIEYASSTKKVVCYYTNWSQYRLKPASFLPEDIDPYLCTHIIYAFAKLNFKSELEAFEWNDENTDWSVGMYSRMMDNKLKNKDLKILLAVGGWNLGSGPFSDMVHDDDKMKNFISTTVQFLLKNKFDGLDLDWEYPGSRNGSRLGDKELFTKLVQVRLLRFF